MKGGLGGPTTFQAAVFDAMAQAAKKRDENERCPKEQDGCGRKGALCTVAKRGVRLGVFCPCCGWSSFVIRGKRVLVKMKHVKTRSAALKPKDKSAPKGAAKPGKASR